MHARTTTTTHYRITPPPRRWHGQALRRASSGLVGVLGDGATGGGGAWQAAEAAEGGAAAAEEGHAADAAGTREGEARAEPAAAGEAEARHAAAGEAAAASGPAGHHAVEGREGLRLHHRVVLLLRRLDVPRLGRRRRRHGQDHQQGRRRYHLRRPRHLAARLCSLFSSRFAPLREDGLEMSLCCCLPASAAVGVGVSEEWEAARPVFYSGGGGGIEDGAASSSAGRVAGAGMVGGAR